VKTSPLLVSRAMVLYEILAFSFVSFRVRCVALAVPFHQVSFSFIARHSLVPTSFRSSFVRSFRYRYSLLRSDVQNPVGGYIHTHPKHIGLSNDPPTEVVT